MTKEKLFKYLSYLLENYQTDSQILVGIDGVDTAGKTLLANELTNLIHNRPVIRLSIDGFHNSRKIRYQKGDLSPNGYYRDSFNYDFLINNVLIPLKNNKNKITSKIFDFISNTNIQKEQITVPQNALIIFDGVFLLRKEIEKFWDIKIFLDITFNEVLHRAIMRDKYLFAEENKLLEKYRKRYIPGQKIYLEEENPKQKADIIIKYDDYENPEIVINKMEDAI
jgi:uridine kinase